MKRNNVRTVKDCLLSGGCEGFVFERSMKEDSYNGGRGYIIGNQGFDRNGGFVVEVNYVDEKEPQRESVLVADILNDRLVTRRV